MEADCLHLRARIQWGLLWSPAIQKARSSENKSMWHLKDFWKTRLRDFDLCPFLLTCVSNIFLRNACAKQEHAGGNWALYAFVHHGRNGTSMGCYLRHRIPNNFVFSCWWRLKYQDILRWCRSLSMSGFQSLALSGYVGVLHVFMCASEWERECVCMRVF